MEININIDKFEMIKQNNNFQTIVYFMDYKQFFFIKTNVKKLYICIDQNMSKSKFYYLLENKFNIFLDESNITTLKLNRSTLTTKLFFNRF